MGLDITAHAKIALAPDAKIEDGEPVAYEVFWIAKQVEGTERDFPGRTEGLVHGACYTKGERSMDFRAGAYSSYNRWREWLARLAGYEVEELFDRLPAEGPFVELINFTDCDGVIGPTCAGKLAKDFATYQTQAETSKSPPGYLEFYNKMRAAFELAADGGAVRFH